MKFLFDLFPVILFFGTYQIFPFFGPRADAMYYATGVVIAATFFQIVWVYFRHRKVDVMLWLSFGIVLLLGGATLFLHDKTYIMWKPSILYWCFSAVLFVSATFFDRNLIQAMMQKQMSAPKPIWDRLNLSWIVFFALMGCANLYVARHYSESTWVNFKMFGTLGLMLVFVLAQSAMLSKYIEEKE
ncbi:MAG: septation protein A [Burkholderiales bacterium]|nr:septation protein A [Burkholderiales bacterium]